ncbi:hypothetical protein GeomeDRAFT_1806 [Geobacter metallireducens RCH3]|uniref:YfdX protein n=1 Tax=Geobacter metallireducens (strain ATCC 53774 / DSM 7210 / GS-15) TaxID=269799 RepID=Q39WW7_GEOMG|nr:YfdX family protein [Geobacter metallireducens]ABB31257.1 hypothetical protein Gmet_1015 [Geobacter metallireducens GS-15]EHP86500.1 hypothetical protein GeomeDRAFT_1806 [Geobacter metallireducens RCH3]
MKRSAFVLLAVLAGYLPFCPAAPAEAVDTPSAGLYRSITQREEGVISRTAVMALRSIVQARADIHQKMLEKARHDLNEATLLMETIRSDLSTAVVRNRIWIARTHLEYETAQRVMEDLPPIFSALRDIEEYFPTDKAKRHIDNAKRYLEKGEKKGAERELHLADNELVVVEVELPIAKAETYVTRAKEYLARNDVTKADEALKVAEEKAQAVPVGMESALQRAQSSFWRASRSYAAGKPAEARTYIEQARMYLEKAAKTGNVKGKEEVGTLSRSVTELEQKLDKGDNTAESALASAWNKSRALAERESEYLAARWEEAETTLSVDDDLIEAKLHVSYGETYQVITRESAKAAEELDRAAAYLDKAMKNSLLDQATIKRIGAIRKEVTSLREAPEQSDEAWKDRYDQIKDEINKLLRQV